MTEDQKLHWFAGVYEGEGTCAVVNGVTFYLSVTQKDEWLCQQLKTLFGGNWGGPYRSKSHPFYSWRLCGKAAQDLVALALPLLSPRRQAQVETVLRKKTRRGRSDRLAV